MRIRCPFCGERDAVEFIYLGDAGKVRPDGTEASQQLMLEYVYLRDNPAGKHRELWHHSAGCSVWLAVTRDTRNHDILSVEPAREATLRRLAGDAA